MEPLPPSPSPRSFWRAPLLFWAALVLLLLIFLQAVSAILLPFLLGMGLAYMFDPVADRMERAGLSRGAATAIITVGLFAGVVGLLVWLVPVMFNQLAGLVSMVPELLARLEQFAEGLIRPVAAAVPGLDAQQAQNGMKQSVEALSQELVGSPGAFAKQVLNSGAKLLNLLSLLFITPIVSFYALHEWDRMKASVNRLLPLPYAPTIRAQCHEIDAILAGFLRGQMNVMLLLAIYYSVALTALSVPFGLVIGIASAALVIVPYIGTLVSFSLAAGSAWVHAGLGTELYAVCALYAAGQFVEQQILTPKIIGDKVGLHPLWMLFAMLSGAALFGFAGVLLAVPVAAVLGVLVRFAVGQYLESPYYHGRGDGGAAW